MSLLPQTTSGAIARVRGGGRRLLLAWEMGEGLGHANRLLALARLLQQDGWFPIVAARHPSTLAQRYADARIPVIPAPVHRSCFSGPGRFRAATFADIMGVCGYANPEWLAHLVNTWDDILREQAPVAVISDYSPLLSLAAFGRLPLIAVGDGFVTPPGLPDGCFPLLHPEAPPVWDADGLLQAARRIQSRRGLELPGNLPQIMAGTGQITTVPRELDIYADRRPGPAAGSWESVHPPLPPPQQPCIFAYLRMSHALARRVMQLLVDLRLPGECYLHDATPAMVLELKRAGIVVHASPPPLRESLNRASFVIHHGGIGTLEDALTCGRPQLLLPRHLEQELNARRANRSLPGVYTLMPSTSTGQLRHSLTSLLTNAAPMVLAQQAATGIHSRGESAWPSLQRLLP